MGVTGNAKADREHGLSGFTLEEFANAARDQSGSGDAGLREDKSKFVAAMARGGVYGAGTVFESLAKTAERAVAGLMAKTIVDPFQAIEIEQDERKITPRTLGAANFRMQDFKEAAIVGETGQRIAGSLMAELVFEGALFCDVNDDDFEAGKIPLIVEDTAATEPGFEGRAVLALPLRLDGLNGLRVGRAPGEREADANIGDDYGDFIGGQKLISGGVAQHGDEGEIDVEEFAIRAATVYSIGRIVDQRAIKGLRVLQGFLRILKLLAEFLFIQRPPDRHGQLGEVFALDALESAARIQLLEGQNFAGGGQEDDGNLDCHLRKNLQTLGSLAAGTRVFDENDIVETGRLEWGELGDVQDKIGSDGELSLFQLLQAGVNYFGLTVNEQDAKGTPSVRMGAIGREIPGSGPDAVLCKFCHRCIHPVPLRPFQRLSVSREGSGPRR